MVAMIMIILGSERTNCSRFHFLYLLASIWILDITITYWYRRHDLFFWPSQQYDSEICGHPPLIILGVEVNYPPAEFTTFRPRPI